MAAAPPPEGWDLKGGMPAALEGACDNCPELALVELTPDAFLLSIQHYVCTFVSKDATGHMVVMLL